VEIIFDYFLDHLAWRSRTSGSWFIEALCSELKRSGSSAEILEIMTRVNRRVAVQKFSCTMDSEKNDKKQIPIFFSTLIRKLYFRPK